MRIAELPNLAFIVFSVHSDTRHEKGRPVLDRPLLSILTLLQKVLQLLRTIVRTENLHADEPAVSIGHSTRDEILALVGLVRLRGCALY